MKLKQLGLKCFSFLVHSTLSQAVSPIIKLTQCTVEATAVAKAIPPGSPDHQELGVQVTSQVAREGQGTSLFETMTK